MGGSCRAGGHEVGAGRSSRPSCRRERTDGYPVPLAEVHTLGLRAGRRAENPDVARKFGGHRVRGSAVRFAR